MPKGIIYAMTTVVPGLTSFQTQRPCHSPSREGLISQGTGSQRSHRYRPPTSHTHKTDAASRSTNSRRPSSTT